MNTYPHSHPLPLSHTHTHAHSLPPSLPPLPMHTHTHAITHTHTHSPSPFHCTHTHSLTHSLTHSHAHSLSPSPPSTAHTRTHLCVWKTSLPVSVLSCPSAGSKQRPSACSDCTARQGWIMCGTLQQRGELFTNELALFCRFTLFTLLWGMIMQWLVLSFFARWNSCDFPCSHNRVLLS